MTTLASAEARGLLKAEVGSNVIYYVSVDSRVGGLATRSARRQVAAHPRFREGTVSYYLSGQPARIPKLGSDNRASPTSIKL